MATAAKTTKTMKENFIHVVSLFAVLHRRPFPRHAPSASAKGQDAQFGGLMNRLRRVGYKVDDVDAPIDNVELTRCLRASGLAIEDRFEFRALLSAYSLIEP